MGQLATSDTSLSNTLTASGGTSDLLAAIAPVASNADGEPRLISSVSSLYSRYGYCEGLEFVRAHIRATRKPVVFCGVPIATPGAIGRVDASNVTGGGTISASAGGNGVLREHSGIFRITAGGTVASDQLRAEYSLDDGVTFKPIRIGLATSYAVPYVGVTVNLAGVLSTGAEFRWFGSSPVTDAAGVELARAGLASQSFNVRSAILIGDCPSTTLANAVASAVNTYQTENGRSIYARASVRDRLPYGAASHTVARMAPSTSLTFAEVGASADTITRATGSWITDGFAIGDTIVITGATASAGANNITAVIANLTATVITLGAEDLTAEVSSNCAIVGYPTITFAEVGASGDTITRNRGSWVADGFRAGVAFEIDGTASNDGAHTAATVTDLVLTLGTDDLDAEVIALDGDVSLIAGESEDDWMASLVAEYDNTVTGERFVDLSAGRAIYTAGSYDGWQFRVPACWAISIREYQHDRHIATWRTSDDALAGFSIFDATGKRVEYDDRVSGGAASIGRFSSLRSYSNGGRGTFVSQSLTRADSSDLLSQTHHASVVAKFRNLIQMAQEKLIIGQNLELNSDGTATTESLATIERAMQDVIDAGILAAGLEGPNASEATWTATPDTDYRVPTPTMYGTGYITLNGTVHSVSTEIQVNTGS